MKILSKLLVLTLSSTFGWVLAQPVTLSLWSRDSDRALVTPLVEEWSATHNNQIEPTIVPAGQFVTKFATAVAGGAAPDIVALDLVYTPVFMAAEQLTDITELAQSLPFFDELSPAHVELGTWSDDKIYALPFSAEGSVLMYNKDLFRQAGLDPRSAADNLG